jgi:hypothetical protein
MSYNEYHSRAKHVILSVGDMIHDLVSNRSAILVQRIRRIDIVEDDIYWWEVNWITSAEDTEVPLPDHIEEEGLKLSIVVGLTEWHSIDGGTYEP